MSRIAELGKLVMLGRYGIQYQLRKSLGTTQCGDVFVHGGVRARWIEDANKSFRFVDYCDNVSKHVTHNGWYIDCNQHDTYRGVVYRLAKGRGYVGGYVNSQDATNGACIEMEIYDTKEEAAWHSDSFAERAAEEERDYHEAALARFEYDELEDECNNHKEVLKGAEVDIERVCETDKEVVRPYFNSVMLSAQNEMVAARKKMQELKETYGKHKGWQQ